MGFETVFKRYELKYFLTKEQQQNLLDLMKNYMYPDKYGRTTIRNIYFDTDNYRLIRRSIEKPVYKEKLRIRSYKKANDDDPVFVELKKKFKHIVYKRRLTLPQLTAISCLSNNIPLPVSTQIADEINYFCSYYGNLHPVVFLSYERDAYYSVKRHDFRITFDENILFRCENFSFNSEIYGTPILHDNLVLMEIKTAGGIPLWMTDWLTANKVFRTSFSKYGTAYQQSIFKEVKGGTKNA